MLHVCFVSLPIGLPVLLWTLFELFHKLLCQAAVDVEPCYHFTVSHRNTSSFTICFWKFSFYMLLLLHAKDYLSYKKWPCLKEQHPCRNQIYIIHPKTKLPTKNVKMTLRVPIWIWRPSFNIKLSWWHFFKWYI